ncbi:DUF805 domain-containing protein [Stakelama tenebrarum]|uniref:DUF805 domain-containing protein n=1 Tax=Stakelama tenebrarum TaxID=2711215 RepID=A0A6G6Y463_9SPHN|nr:DUF805 domain-containing protein [Sphingosinithalassobacter tenebrarum]QIG79597.1 DUF805 domain-containing protein [Sphingosinithalassobacter tenebrarum]
MQWMFLPYKRFFDFEGRSTRREYWLFALLQLIIAVGVAFLQAMFTPGGGEMVAGPGAYPGGDPFAPAAAPASPASLLLMGLYGLYTLAMIIPSIAVGIRRLHDSDRSGLWYLILFVPLIGALVMLVFTLLPGTEGENRFGPDPRDPEDLAELEATF